MSGSGCPRNWPAIRCRFWRR